MNACQWLYLIEPGQEAVWGADVVALSEVARSGVPVLPAFVISRDAIAAFFVQSSLKKSIMAVAKEAPFKKPELLAGYTKEIREHILKAPFPKLIQGEMAFFFKELEDQVLRKPKSGLRVTITELGTNHSLTQVLRSTTEGEVLIKQLLTLSFTEEALYARHEKGGAVVHGANSILVQFSEEADYSGRAFCYDFARHDDSTIAVQAHYHERAKKDRLAPADEYKVDRSSLLLLSREIAAQAWAEKKSGRHHRPSQKGKSHPVLQDEQVLYLARLVKRAQALFNDPYCFHWCFSHNQLFITQIEPFTAEIETSQRQALPMERTGPQPLLLGMPGNLGFVSGTVRMIRTKADQESLKDGEVAVVEQMKAGDHSWLAGAAALIVETGHRASMEVHLAKQLGIPGVVATGQALSHLSNGQLVTVDGTHGAVYAGHLTPPSQPTHTTTLPVTGTKILATVLDPQQISREDLAHSDGVGLLRSEFILRMLGVHPEDILRKRLHNEYVDILAEGIESAVRAVFPRPVIYQLHDMHTAHTLGWRARHQDRHEPNPTLGYRGTHRLLAEPDVLELELKALAKVAAQGITSLSIMLPMVRNLSEVEDMYALLKKSEFVQHTELSLWVKCETPALAIRAEELGDLPIKGVCFDIPALSTLIVGVDKENYQIGHHLDQADDAVRQALVYGITTCRSQGIATTIVAEMETLRPEIVQAAIQAGVTGICVAPSEIEEMHGLVASIEQRMVLDHLLAESEPVEA
jgi:pyruvate,water dikinase